MTYPCDGHPCDHCYLCDVVGVCCMTVTAGQRAKLEADDRAQRNRDSLHAALQEAGTVPTLRELVRLEARRYPAGLIAASRLGLLSAPSADPVPDSRKEPAHVPVSRTLR
jgi:hypothetical protein